MKDLVVLLCLLPAALAFRFHEVLNQQPKYCSLPSVRGECDGSYTHYFYNRETESCEPFTYSGCDGNRNNFRSFSECRAACVCTLGAERERADGQCTRQYYYDVTDGKCRRYRYRSCNSRANRFKKEQFCEKSCPTARCYLGMDRGSTLCGQPDVRYFYNRTAEQCQKFRYSGCVGNLNNFGTLEDCDNSCTEPIRKSVGQTTPHPDCFLPKSKPVCKQTIERFYFNTETGECESFIYGGCHGNGNNYNSLEKCRKVCMPPQPRD
ncbi:boophilin-H2-like [Aplysia californica]|uniref:Boophilin-H2-like n=1 Tax=Aplysia californica TaxID=6500 RepID=A0ABM0JQT1_APLCA|nr:boophilin-H2-like [Aplysia californica]